MFNEYTHVSPCSLLKIFWLRLIVDEGHRFVFVIVIIRCLIHIDIDIDIDFDISIDITNSMGKNGAPSNSIDFASWITAERRWVSVPCN